MTRAPTPAPAALSPEAQRLERVYETHFEILEALDSAVLTPEVIVRADAVVEQARLLSADVTDVDTRKRLSRIASFWSALVPRG